MPYRKILLLLAASTLLVAVTWRAYSPGMYGDFLFDDYGNLPLLGTEGPIHSWPVFWRYITSGFADPIGRPVALLSFLIDTREWPASPSLFLRTNLIIHLWNGGLLLALLRQLGRQLYPNLDPASSQATRLDLAALFGAAFWLLHPLFVSTTLYIVQREAMLPATFTLLGLWLWLRGRTDFRAGKLLNGTLWMSVGLTACTALATLSKGNGILLPALALVVEACLPALRHLAHTCSQPDKASIVYRWTMRLLAWPVTLAVIGYLAYTGWHGWVYGIGADRAWTLGQRLLTEPRILMDYLGLLWLPRPYTTGLFNDSFTVSTSLFSPIATLPALLAVASLIACAWQKRSCWPAAAMAILFYFVGQSLESSTVPLELYFEHRNYLPALLMFWPLALWLCGATGKSHLVSPYLRVGLAVLLLASLGFMTHLRASLWGNTHDQALIWAQFSPDSPRAQANAAQEEMAEDHPLRAIARLAPMLQKHPDEVQLALNLFSAECQAGQASQTTLDASRQALRMTRDPGALLLHWFERMIVQTHSPPCPQLTLDTLRSLLDATQANPVLGSQPGRLQDILHLRGTIALAANDTSGALHNFNQALDQQVNISTALVQAAQLGSAGHAREGLAHLAHFEAERKLEPAPGPGMPSIHAWVLRHQHYWDNELQRLRQTLIKDASHQKN